MIIRYIAALWRWFGRQGYPCLFRLLTGFYCPGCGGTRALKYLLQGQVFKSLYYHPLILYMAIVGAVEGSLWAADKMRGQGSGDAGRNQGRGMEGDRDRKRRPYEKEIYVGLGIIAVNWAVKNWVLAVMGIPMIP